MNLLFFSNIFPDVDHPTRGAFNYELCRAMSTENEVRVISPRSWPEALPYKLSGRSYQSRLNPEGAAIEAVYPVSWYTPKVLREYYGDFLWQSSRGTVRRLAETFVPQAVLSYWAHPDGEAGLRAAREFGVPSVVIVGGSDVLLLPNNRRRGVRIRRVLSESDAVITISEGLREKTIELGVDPAYVHTIQQGINPQLFFADDRPTARSRLATQQSVLEGNRPMLLWVGRMVNVKRLDVLVSAADELRCRGRDFVLCLAGDGPLRDRIAHLVTERNLNDFVHFTGPLPPESLGDWYRAADVSVMSSESEGLPNVLRESLACGTPFVSTDVGSIGEIADERYAVLVPSGDAKALAEGVETVLDGSHQEHARRYQPRTWDMMAKDVMSLIQHYDRGETSTAAREEEFCHVG